MLILIRVQTEQKSHEKAILRANCVLGASDGIVTTFAIITGSAGAALSSTVIIILGSAKLFADAVSMASGIFLGLKSEIDYQKADGAVHRHSLMKHSLFTFASFVVAGVLPLVPYLWGFENALKTSVVVVFFELFAIGALKTLGTKRKWFLGGFEMLIVGGLAAFVAYIVGYFINGIVV